MQLHGVYAAIPTAFGADFALALPELRANVRAWNRFELQGLLVLGSTGEFVHLNRDEKLQLIECVRDEMAPGRRLLAGTGCPTTAETIALTRASAQAGADLAVVIHPNYYRAMMTDAALLRFYQEVADASPIPVLVYNMPGCTGMDLSAELLIRIGGHENIVGWKDSGSNLPKMKAVIAEMGARFELLIGSASLLLDALSIGAAGGILALANIAPRECVELKQLCAAGKRDAAQTLQQRLTPINQAVTAKFGIAGLKVALDALGLYGGPVRQPLLGLDAAARLELANVLRAGELTSLT